VLPYVLISYSYQMFSWKWCALYAALPVAIAWLLGRAAIVDPKQRGNWRDANVLLTVGLAVDLRWFERGRYLVVLVLARHGRIPIQMFHHNPPVPPVTDIQTSAGFAR
jgi:hypothetical protein